MCLNVFPVASRGRYKDAAYSTDRRRYQPLYFAGLSQDLQYDTIKNARLAGQAFGPPQKHLRMWFQHPLSNMLRDGQIRGVYTLSFSKTPIIFFAAGGLKCKRGCFSAVGDIWCTTGLLLSGGGTVRTGCGGRGKLQKLKIAISSDKISTSLEVTG